MGMVTPSWFESLIKDEKEAVRNWLRGHDLDPDDVPVDGIRYDAVAQEWVITVFMRNRQGKFYFDRQGDMATAEVRRPGPPPPFWGGM
jgi:hypothetical protein